MTKRQEIRKLEQRIDEKVDGLIACHELSNKLTKEIADLEIELRLLKKEPSTKEPEDGN